MTLTLAAFSLSACQSAGVSGGCPPLIAYSADFQRAAARELRKMPQDSRAAQLVADYKKFRDACRIGGAR